jgi:precorrin-4/cobalt-precorrin-4 C11-methyltransferase
MKVYFIGGGPGAPDLITLRGANLLATMDLVMYAGSLVPQEVMVHCKKGARIVNTAGLNLDEQVALFQEALDQNLNVARVHSGDPTIYGAMAEQIKRLAQLGIEYEIVPGVSSFTAAAASLQSELTKPSVSQSIILTRVSGRASEVPDSEAIAEFARHRATMCIFLSGPHLKQIVSDLLLHYSADTPVALVCRASQPDESRYSGTLGTILAEVDVNDWKLTTMMIVGDVLDKTSGTESKLYSASYSHKFRSSVQGR